MTTFLEELEEHVRTLNQELLALEKGPPAEEAGQRLKAVFRAAHSLKGAARSVSLPLIEGACHQLEEILAAARDGLLTLGAEHFALLFATADGIEEAGMRLREQQLQRPDRQYCREQRPSRCRAGAVLVCEGMRLL